MWGERSLHEKGFEDCRAGVVIPYFDPDEGGLPKSRIGLALLAGDDRFRCRGTGPVHNHLSEAKQLPALSRAGAPAAAGPGVAAHRMHAARTATAKRRAPELRRRSALATPRRARRRYLPRACL